MSLPPGRYGFADLAIGDQVVTGSRRITADLITEFARVSGDTYEIHMDADAARAKGFARRVAHGLLVLSVIDGLKNTAPARLDGLASLGWDWRFRAPVLEGDAVRAVFTIADKRITRSGQRGIATIAADVFNQEEVVVQSGQNQLIFDL